jgi:hypothetical protein
MRVFQDPTEGRWEQDRTSLAVGAATGLAIGLLLSRVFDRPAAVGTQLKERARSAVRRLQPGRLQRLGFEQEALDRLEDAVLNGFLGDSVLRERGIDIGAISVGIIEISGRVASQVEIQRAVALANRIPGVRTVVNRLEVEVDDDDFRLRRRLEDHEHSASFMQEGRVGGMGRRRQSPATDPDRPDDSHKLREEALAAADRDQWEDEGLARRTSRVDARPEVQAAGGARFSEAELDNQDPHGKHAERTLDEQPQQFRSESRVGDPPKPGIQRALEDSELPLNDPPVRDSE